MHLVIYFPNAWSWFWEKYSQYIIFDISHACKIPTFLFVIPMKKSQLNYPKYTYITYQGFTLSMRSFVLRFFAQYVLKIAKPI